MIDAVIAFPMAFYMAKVASPRSRAFFLVAVTTPLWASYLVKAYAWRVLLEPNGPIDIVTRRPRARVRAAGHGRSRWPTCGCRT